MTHKNRQATNQPMDRISTLLAVLAIILWLIVIGLNRPWSMAFDNRDTFFNLGFVIYAISSLISFLVYFPVTRKVLTIQRPWELAIATIVATVMGAILYYFTVITIVTILWRS